MKFTSNLDGFNVKLLCAAYRIRTFCVIDVSVFNYSFFFPLQAAQTDDPLKAADAVVSVTVEDVNDNPPEFDRSDYSVSLLENSPVGVVLFKAAVTDLDQVDFTSHHLETT